FSVIAPGGSIVSTVSLAALNGFSGSATLTVTAPAGFTTSLSSATINAVTPATLTVTAQAGVTPGVFTINVTGINGVTIRTTGVVVIVAPSIGTGQSVIGSLTGDDQPDVNFTSSLSDLYRIVLPSTTTVTIDLLATEFDPFLRLMNSSGSTITTSDNFGTGKNSRILTTLSAGTYYIDVTSAFSESSGLYRLLINLPLND